MTGIADSQDWLFRLEDLGAALRQLPICRPTALLGEEGRGFYAMMAGLETARVHTAARAIGLARGALEDSRRLRQRRSQFSQPIGDFQAIRFKLAEMAANIEAARQLMYFVATEVDSKRRCDKEASMVKWFASEMAERVTSDALQIHGGYGYTKDPADRALLARRAADQDFRGHLANPAAHHLGPAAGRNA